MFVNKSQDIYRNVIYIEINTLLHQINHGFAF